MKFSQTILLLNLVVWFNASFGQLSREQQKEIETLNSVIAEDKHDTLVAQAYLDLLEILEASSFHCDRSLRKISEDIDEQLGIAVTLNNIGIIYLNHGDSEQALYQSHL
ncbi:MAG: hypothetical protein ACI865_002532 [Flavobacteriaceae bacterium]|jgi:hypothetical protein